MKYFTLVDRNHMRRIVLLVAAVHLAPAFATELVYSPVNPNFGGSPLNGSALLGSAQSTNKHKDPEAERARSAAAATQKNGLQQFNDMLERSILSQLSGVATGKILNGGKLTPGSVETGNFRIDISDLGGGVLLVTTTDKVTGASTSFRVGGGDQ
jgi:curli production assembly/transport component CsgF